MKKIILLLVTALAIFAFGCEKEKIERENQIEFEDELYPISWGVYVHYQYKGLNYIELRLCPSSMFWQPEKGYPGGYGTFMGFALVSYTNTPEGTYSLPIEGINEPKAGQIQVAGIITWPEEKDAFMFDVEGQLNVLKFRDNYEISFSGIEKGGKSITAYYKGPLFIGD